MNMMNQIKWAWQRVVRGHDDRLFWDMSTYLDPMVLAMAKHIREHGHGYPTGLTKKKWDKGMDVIIKGFRPEPDVPSAKAWKIYMKDRQKALVLLAYYWDNLWD